MSQEPEGRLRGRTIVFAVATILLLLAGLLILLLRRPDQAAQPKAPPAPPRAAEQSEAGSRPRPSRSISAPSLDLRA